jgi:hypothetical protein
VTDEPRRFLHGRSLSPLIKPWIAGLIVAGLVFFFETEMPAFHEVVKIVYFVIAVILVIVTGRAFRSRERGRRVGERRHGDRRRHDTES